MVSKDIPHHFMLLILYLKKIPQKKTRKRPAIMKFQFLMATTLAIFMFASTSQARPFPKIYKMGPPPGPRDQALCPVTGEKILIMKDTASVSFKHGQKLYFSSIIDCRLQFRRILHENKIFN